MWLFEIKQDIASMRRFWFILETVSAYGFHELTDWFPSTHRWRRPGKIRQLDGKTRPEKLRMLMEALGPTFVKLGQILSTRGDLIPAEYAQELTRLTEQTAPFPVEEVRAIIEQELGQKPEELFLRFDEKPLGSASIGQVHGAQLRTGEEVVVKVQRPGIGPVMEQDLVILRYIAEMLEEYDRSFARYRPVEVVDSFAASLRKELNYQFEASNLSRFTKDMEKCPGISAPRCFDRFSTAKVLTMERVNGVSATKVMAEPELRKKFDLPKIAENGVRAIFSQIFEHGFFHADPHPGNLFLREGNDLCFLDFGMMGRVTRKERRDFVRALSFMVRGDIPQMVDSALRLTVSGKVRGSRDSFEREVADMVDANINLPMDKLSFGGILESLLALLSRYEIALKPDLYLMCKAVISVEHVGRDFDPHLKVIELLKPFLTRARLRDFDPRPMIRCFLDDFEENFFALESFPRDVHRFLQRMSSGEVTLKVEHHRLDEIEQTLYITGERISRALLLTALILGSALIIVAKIPPFWCGIPVIGAAGFCIAGILSLFILWADHRQRRRFLRDKALRRLRRENGHGE